MPNSKGLVVKDSIANERKYNIGAPAMDAYIPSREEKSFGAILILPGVEYSRS